MKTIFSGKILTIPNLLSFFRILLIPWFMWIFLAKDNGSAAAMILLLSGLTDTLDGMIARRFNMISNLGKALDPLAQADILLEDEKALDPLADKLTQIAVMACLVVRFPHMWAVLFALCVKELFVLASSLMAIRRTEEVLPADWHGKITTTTLYATMIAHLLFPGMPGTLSDGLLTLCIGMILLSGILYGIRNIRAIRSAKEDEL